MKLNLLFKLSNLSSNFALTLGYLNLASSNPALIESTPGEIVLQRNRIFKMLTTLNIHLCQ